MLKNVKCKNNYSVVAVSRVTSPRPYSGFLHFYRPKIPGQSKRFPGNSRQPTNIYIQTAVTYCTYRV